MKTGLLFVPTILKAQLPVIPYPPCPCWPAVDIVNTWAGNVVSNGGAAPSAGTKSALTTFVCTLQCSGLWTQMLSINCFVPDSVIACNTPLLDPQFTLWSTFPSGAFAAGQLTVNGLAGDGTHYLQTGTVPGTPQFIVTSAGMSMYCYDTASGDCKAGANNGASSSFTMGTAGALTVIDIWSDVNTGDRASVANNNQGFYSGNRIANNNLQLYFANSGTAFSSVGSNTNTSTTPLPTSTGRVYVHAIDVNSTSVVGISTGRLSFFASHSGLTSTYANALYVAVQAMRVSLGGGFR